MPVVPSMGHGRQSAMPESANLGANFRHAGLAQPRAVVVEWEQIPAAPT